MASQVCFAVAFIVTLGLLQIRSREISSIRAEFAAQLACHPTCLAQDVIRYAREENARGEQDDLAPDLTRFPVDFTLPSEAATRREEVLREFALAPDLPFSSLEELRELVGDNCAPLRHCAHKTGSGSLFIGPGQWKTSLVEETSFHPNNCWLYNFKKDEPWAQAGIREVERVAIFLDGQGSKYGLLEEVSRRWDRFAYVEIQAPTTVEEEHLIQQEILKQAGIYTDEITLTIFVNWLNPGKELGLVRRMLRIANEIDLRSVSVIWLSLPYPSDELELKDVIRNNEIMASALEKVRSRQESGILVQRRKATQMRLDELPDPPRITFDDLTRRMNGVILIDVREEQGNSDGNGTEGFVQAYALHLSFESLKDGKSPNVHFESRIAVVGDDMTDTIAATQLLIKQGFTNAQVLDGDLSKWKFHFSSSLPVRLYDHTELKGADLFSATLSIPDVVAKPAESEFAIGFLLNLALNYMYSNEIMGAASYFLDDGSGEDGFDDDDDNEEREHLCAESAGACTSCLPVEGRIPSSRMSFEIINTFLHERSVPTVVELKVSERIFDGSWEAFIDSNKDASIFIRRNYSSSESRTFERQTLWQYLENSGILEMESDGSYILNVMQESVPWSEELLNLKGTKPVYAGNNKLNVRSMANLNFLYPAWMEKKQLQRPSMWLGPRGSFTSLHVDHENRGNMVYPIFGKKDWHLFPPRSTPFMYGKKVGVVTWSSVVDPLEFAFSPEKQKMNPDFRLAIPESLQIVLNEGELLYNPEMWWHSVYNVKAALMLSFWLKVIKSKPLIYQSVP